MVDLDWYTKMVTTNIEALIILDVDSKRTMSKCSISQTNTRQFEKKLYIKTEGQKLKDETLVIDNLLIIYRFMVGVQLYVLENKGESYIVLDPRIVFIE